MSKGLVLSRLPPAKWYAHSLNNNSIILRNIVTSVSYWLLHCSWQLMVCMTWSTNIACNHKVLAVNELYMRLIATHIHLTRVYIRAALQCSPSQLLLSHVRLTISEVHDALPVCCVHDKKKVELDFLRNMDYIDAPNNYSPCFSSSLSPYLRWYL